MRRRSLLRSLELWLIALLLLGQCVQAAHFHVFAPGPAPAAVHHVKVAGAGDAGCLLCWAQQAAQNAPWIPCGVLSAIAVYRRALPSPRLPETAPVRSPSPPRAPPLA